MSTTTLVFLFSFFLQAAFPSIILHASFPNFHERPANITTYQQLDAAINVIGSNAAPGNGSEVAWGFQEVLSQRVPAKAPATIPDALSNAALSNTAPPKSLPAYVAALVLEKIFKANLDHLFAGYLVYSNQANSNRRQPSSPIYPQKSNADAPYALPEAELRSKIYIPPAFTYGAKAPVILIPGTGVEAGLAFAPNFGKLLAATDFADPVYVNIPHHMVDDVQTNAEYVAYATNYIASISGGANVTLLGWSQASIATRWAHKYWPSTRLVTSSTVNLSPDYHGTMLAYLPCPAGFATCSPAALQQLYNSTFIATLRSDGGDSAYVPLTTVYSKFDQVVQPQAGTGASGYSDDARGVGVTNVYLQDHCGSTQPGGAIWNTHEGVLYNALAAAAAMDAIRYGANADMSRIDIAAQCKKLVADGLSLADVLATSATIPVAGFNILAFPKKQALEPRIRDYARKDIPAGYVG